MLFEGCDEGAFVRAGARTRSVEPEADLMAGMKSSGHDAGVETPGYLGADTLRRRGQSIHRFRDGGAEMVRGVRRGQGRQIAPMDMVRRRPERDRLLGDEIAHLAGKEGDRAVEKKAGAQGERVPDGCGQPLGRDPPIRRDGLHESVRNIGRHEGQAVGCPVDGLARARRVAQDSRRCA
ncbi:hypothetical protein D3C86_1423800 [compost metagenome]